MFLSKICLKTRHFAMNALHFRFSGVRLIHLRNILFSRASTIILLCNWLTENLKENKISIHIIL
jgi:hypothetical protein